MFCFAHSLSKHVYKELKSTFKSIIIVFQDLILIFIMNRPQEKRSKAQLAKVEPILV